MTTRSASLPDGTPASQSRHGFWDSNKAMWAGVFASLLLITAGAGFAGGSLIPGLRSAGQAACVMDRVPGFLQRHARADRSRKLPDDVLKLDQAFSHRTIS
jgi:hypothetical protein